MKRFILVALAAYCAGYLAIRATQAEVWERDGNTYVLFPESPIALWYLYRPLTLLDARLTGMRFHIGPHR